MLAFEFFIVTVYDPDAFAGEWNAFIAGHKVASIRKQFVDCGETSFWAICVDYHRTGDATATASDANISRNRMDYKTILPANEFVVYSQLRELRNELALAESRPVYALFSNEQLPQVVQRRWSPLKRLSLVCLHRPLTISPRRPAFRRRWWRGNSIFTSGNRGNGCA